VDGDLARIGVPGIGDVDGVSRGALLVLAVAFLRWLEEDEAGVGVSGVRGRSRPLLGGVAGDET
jgi:hypothetical protein